MRGRLLEALDAARVDVLISSQGQGWLVELATARGARITRTFRRGGAGALIVWLTLQADDLCPGWRDRR